ncbi:MAG: OmpH family outer membrane protein [Planctomycetota bacterium]|nr:OmpH family outer membrane protein [Planctomycetota bacterium]
MRSQRFWFVALVAVALSLTALVGAKAGQMLKARPTAVAAIDVEKVFNSLREKTQIEAELNARKDKIAQELQDKSKDLKSLQDDLGVLNAANAAFKKKQEELERKAFELKVWQEWQNAAFMRESGLQTASLYRKIVASAGKVAKENGYDMVVYREGEPELNPAKPEDIKQMIRNRKVLWAADDIDVTEQVTTAMNIEYANSAGAASKPAPK